MKSLPISEIKVAANRQRREFDPAALNELRESIEAHGLLHPVVLRKEGTNYILVAGERRLRAIEDINALSSVFTCDGELVPAASVPYILLGELDELAREEAEWDENNVRQDLTWQEKAAGSARLLSIRTKQAATAGQPLPTHVDIAVELGKTSGSASDAIRQEIIVARHLDNPDVAGAGSVKEAYKVLKKQEQVKQNRELAAQVGLTFSASMHRAVNANSQEEMRRMAALSQDVILTDPPYGMGADQFGDSGGMADGAHGYDDSSENLLAIMGWFAPESYRIAQTNAHLYLFCDVSFFDVWKDHLTSAGWKCFRTPLIWHNPNASRAPWPFNGPQRKHEFILFAMKGDLKVQKMVGDVLIYPRDPNLGHAAQKPVALYSDLLARSVSPGMNVCDPFSGTGTIFDAAHEHQCRATGIEQLAANYALGVKRIENLRDANDVLGGLLP